MRLGQRNFKYLKTELHLELIRWSSGYCFRKR